MIIRYSRAVANTSDAKQVDVAQDPNERLADPNKSPVKTTEFPFPLSSVRLVHPLPHHITGIMTDTIIQSLTVSSHNHKRYITGTDTSIPYLPRPSPPERPEYDVDTLRIDVEEETWVPRLLAEPFPAGVIDELRGKYSRFRSRHEDAYLAKLQEKEEATKRREEVDKTRMMSPMEEWAEIRRREAEAREEPVLDEGALAKIGRVMAKNKGLDLEIEGTNGEQELRP